MGRVEAIFISAKSGDPMQSVESVRAVPGKGLEGDRYFNKKGSEITLIEQEILEETGLSPAESRRNMITRGIRLNQMVGREFYIGGVKLRGLSLCEPCRHITCESHILKKLVHRGGLRAEILTEGVIFEGAPVF